MNLDLAFVSGNIVSSRAAAISPLDSGFQQGFGIYETVRVKDGRALFLREHLQRMESSRLAMHLQPSRWDVAQAVENLIVAAGKAEAALRITLTAGVGEGSTLAVTLRAIPKVPKPLRVWISRYRKMRGDPVEAIKSTSRARNVLAREEALAQGAFEAILPTNEGDLAEGSVSNLYLVHDGAILTPPLDSGCLPGVTREKILQCAQKLGVALRETAIFPRDLPKAQEMWISNALIGLQAVDEVLGVHSLDTQRPNTLFPRFHEEYGRLVEEALRLPQRDAGLQ